MAPWRILRERLEHLRNGFSFGTLPAHVADDPDDGKPGTGGGAHAGAKTAAGRVGRRPETAHHRLINYRDLGLTTAVAEGEETPPHERRANGAEKAVADLVAAKS